jgi:cytochrome c biogenesis protein
MGAKAHFGSRLWQTLASVKTGIILLIVVAVVSAAGTFILQRPLTDSDQLQQAYSPQTLRWLDLLGLTDVFHAWWFALLLALVGTSIVLVSVDRFPKAWRLLTRPYLRAESHFRAVLPVQKQIPISNPAQAIEVAARTLRQRGLYPRRVVDESGATALFAERNRWSVLSVYVVHLSLLLILAGGIIDAFFGYKGYLSLTPGQQTDKLELRDKTVRGLPFTLRCDGTGQENYPDGTPKKWWSRLTVLENGREVLRKEIVVNDPLVREGIRFYQSGYGITGEVESLLFTVSPAGKPQDATQITLRPNAPATLQDGSTIRLIKFVPDFALQDNQIYTKSNYPDNPAVQLAVIGADGKTSMAWLFPRMGERQGEIPYDLTLNDLQMQAYTGLQVSHEPGQWAVWGGCLLMALGLAMAFYLVHQRYWIAVVEDKTGATVLWLGTAADKSRDHLQEEFNQMAEEIRTEVAAEPKTRAAKREASLVGA